jgi:serine protease inhibitor
MRIIIPTFEIVADFNLNEKLQQLGISQAFENSCDFSGMMRPSGKIDEIIHGATIKVDQFGTEATSATLYKITQKNAPKDFRADHPFLYFITTSDNDYLSKDILFVGTYC